MPTPDELKAVFYPESFYHIVCKSNDGILLFYNPKDYQVFQERFKKFMGDFVSTWSYTLLANHTHHICKIKSAEVMQSFINQLPAAEKTKSMQQWVENIINEEMFDAMLERQMNRFLVSYANYLNNKYERNGSVFQSPFKRISITDEKHLQTAIVYVNANAQKHGVATDFMSYPYSSYHSILNGDHYFIDSEAVLDFFGGGEKFIEIHQEQVAYFYSKDWPSSKLE